MLSASFYHRSRVSARLVTRGSRDTVANVMALELIFQMLFFGFTFTRLSKTHTGAIMGEICISKGDKRHENENKKQHYIYASADALI